MLNEPRIFVAGHRGMVGGAVMRCLVAQGRKNIVTRSKAELDLTQQQAVRDFFAREKIDQVYFAAGKVGGIHANNTYPAQFIYQNLMMEANVIHEAWHSGVQKMLFMGSSCIYPRLAPQPMAENVLLSGQLEPTNEPYAIAKIAGIKLCESYNRQYGKSHGTDYRSVMPTNLYGPGDNYHLQNSHVIPALIRRFHDAKLCQTPGVAIWGSGTPRREFLYVGDMAAASVHVMDIDKATYDAHTQPMQSHINIGFGSDIDIAGLAFAVAKVVGYTGTISFDKSKPDGPPRKLLESSKLRNLGWYPKVKLEAGLALAYADYCKTEAGLPLCIVVKEKTQSISEFASPWLRDVTPMTAPNHHATGLHPSQPCSP
ncbi:GDP-L-fucose synthetase [Polaromonas sp. CG9_12]|nr:GDP-L-fucose synthetase [Polaromonas sp. CG9_12]